MAYDADTQLTPGDHRCTPKDLMDLVRLVYRIWVDPCWNPNAVTDPIVRYDGTPGNCGLRRPWRPAGGKHKGIVWVNGPWSNLLPWALKAIMEHRQNPGLEILFWTHGGYDTKWAAELWREAALIGFWRKRVDHPLGHWSEAKRGDSKHPNILWYLGPATRGYLFYKAFNRHAFIVERRWR